jgi:hypothetical protein
MTADAIIVRTGLILFALGWPALGLVYLFSGYNPVVEWSIPILIGVTIGLVSRWFTDRLGMK